MRLGIADSVMRQVAAAADDLENRSVAENRGLEALADTIVERAAAGAEDDRPAGREQTLFDGRRRDRQHVVEHRVDLSGVRQDALEAFDARQFETRRRHDRARDGQRLLARPRARPAAGDAHLDENAQGTFRTAAPPGAFGQRRNAFEAVSQDMEFERFVTHGGKARIDAFAPRRLVRQDDARKAEMPRDGQLLRRRDRDRPGAALALHGVKLGRHRRLAVGCDEQAVCLQEASHPGVVGLQSVSAKNRRRQGDIAPEQVPALLPNLVEAQ